MGSSSFSAQDSGSLKMASPSHSELKGLLDRCCQLEDSHRVRFLEQDIERLESENAFLRADLQSELVGYQAVVSTRSIAQYHIQRSAHSHRACSPLMLPVPSEQLLSCYNGNMQKVQLHTNEQTFASSRSSHQRSIAAEVDMLESFARELQSVFGSGLGSPDAGAKSS